MYAIELEEVGKHSILTVGGKGANLGEMLSNNFPVPQGFCVASSAYDHYIRENNFSPWIEKYLAEFYAAPERGAELSAKLIERLRAGKMPQEIYSEIERLYQKLGDHVRVAIRSSATAEDLPEASFAGQQETYLNVQGLAQVIQAVKCCFASLWTERAVAYRRKTGFDKQKVSLAVVVQEMVDSDISGVLFTVNPVNSNPSEMMINASYGLGEAIVSGIVTPDTFIWDKQRKRVTQRELGSKEISIVYEFSGGTLRKQNSAEARGQYSISEQQLHLLTGIAEQIEKHYGAPQDIEWAVKNNKVYILQSRGITTLRAGANSRDEANADEDRLPKKQNRRMRMMMNNFLEHCPTPLTPLDYQPFYAVAKGKADTMKPLGLKMTADEIILKESGELEVQEMTIRITPAILCIPFKIKEYSDFKKNHAATQRILQDVKQQLSALEALEQSKLDVNELIGAIQTLMRLANQIIYVRFRYNIYPGILIGKLINAKLKKQSLPVSQYDLYSGLHYITWDMNMAIGRLAEQINHTPELKKHIVQLRDDIDPHAALEKLSHQYVQFGAMYDEVMEKYGWKSTSTYLAFSASSWREDKRHFLSLLRIALKRQDRMTDNGKYHAICRQIQSVLPQGKAERLLKQIEESRIYHQNREESLYLLECCYGISRTMAREIASRYPDVFSSPKDILYLTLDEVYGLSQGVPAGIADKIETRQKAMLANCRLWSRMEVQTMKPGGKQLKGISGNRGKVSGKVCLVKELSEFGKLKPGDILVCKYTDPIWTPLFTIAKAVVSDTGGPLSHSAIVAREYNIPAVLGCGNATRTLIDGQEILVDGDEGVVHILK